jgi:uncharacterized membrane protein
MSDRLGHELKKEFQLERMILFSDAVFAIAITLLVIEIKVPEIDRHIATDEMLQHSLGEMIPKFIGFFFSFFIIGLYWTIHHRMFGYVINYTAKLLRLNLIFLLAVALMPFSTAFYSEYILRLLKTPFIIYTANILFLGLANFFLWRYLTNPKYNLTEGLTAEDRRYASLRAIMVPSVFVVAALFYLFVHPLSAVYIPMLIPITMRIIRNRKAKAAGRIQEKGSKPEIHISDGIQS